MTVAFRPPQPHALLWIDIEATSLPEKNNFDKVLPLEVAVIITDFDLDPYGGYEALITPTPAHIEALKDPNSAVEMHRKNGLLAAIKAGPTESMSDVEAAIIGVIKNKTTFGKGEFMIAGSGVARYDYGLLDRWMPNLTEYFAYYPFDIGVARRTNKILSGGRQLVPPHTASYGDDKLHRALADVQAHIEEARSWRKFFDGVK